MHYDALPPAGTLLLLTTDSHSHKHFITTSYLLLQIHTQPEACNLEDIFGRDKEKKRWHRRTSSGHWDADRLNGEEERIYKTAMGFFRP